MLYIKLIHQRFEFDSDDGQQAGRRFSYSEIPNNFRRREELQNILLQSPDDDRLYRTP